MLFLGSRWFERDQRMHQIPLVAIRFTWEIPVRQRCATWRERIGGCAAATALYEDGTGGLLIFGPCTGAGIIAIGTRPSGEAVMVCRHHANELNFEEREKRLKFWNRVWLAGSLVWLAAFVAILWRIFA